MTSLSGDWDLIFALVKKEGSKEAFYSEVLIG